VHAEPVISLVLEGDGVEEVGGRTRLLTAHDLLMTPAYALHGYRFGHTGRWFNMQLTDSWLARVAEGTPALPTAAQIVHSHAAAAWATRVANGGPAPRHRLEPGDRRRDDPDGRGPRARPCGRGSQAAALARGSGGRHRVRAGLSALDSGSRADRRVCIPRTAAHVPPASWRHDIELR
jgi:hypothetical protein